MKFLTNNRIALLNQILSAQCSERRNLTSRVEFYQVESTDFVDFRTHSYERPPFQYSFGTSPDSFMGNPMYSVECFSSSIHFPALKSALETTFPDYDFSMLCPWHFKLIQSAEQARLNMHWAITSYLSDTNDLSNMVWQAIDSEIQIGMCDIYEYQSDCPDPFSAMDSTFNFLYFFLNEKANKIFVFHLQESSLDDSLDNDSFEEQYGFNIF